MLPLFMKKGLKNLKNNKMGRIVKIYEDFENDENEKYELHWNKFIDFLNDKDFDFYDNQNDLEDFFKETANSEDYSLPEEKAEAITAFMEEKWGLFDGYKETQKFLERLF